MNKLRLKPADKTKYDYREECFAGGNFDIISSNCIVGEWIYHTLAYKIWLHDRRIFTHPLHCTRSSPARRHGSLLYVGNLNFSPPYTKNVCSASFTILIMLIMWRASFGRVKTRTGSRFGLGKCQGLLIGFPKAVASARIHLWAIHLRAITNTPRNCSLCLAHAWNCKHKVHSQRVSGLLSHVASMLFLVCLLS